MTEKKRTTYKKGSKFDLPKSVDQKKYGYRWVGKEKFADSPDGFDERGYELCKSEEGSVIRNGDLLLARMPIDMHEERKASIEEARVGQNEFVLDKQAAEDDKLAHEFKQKGGKMKFNYSQE